MYVPLEQRVVFWVKNALWLYYSLFWRKFNLIWALLFPSNDENFILKFYECFDKDTVDS